MPEPKTPEELAAENAALKQANADLKNRNKALSETNAEMDAELAKQPVAAARDARSLPEGTSVCYVRGRETMNRRAEILTPDVETVRTASGVLQCAHFAYHNAGPLVAHSQDKPDHTFETTRPFNALGAPDTWHLPDECPYQGDPERCPYAKPAKAARAVQAP